MEIAAPEDGELPGLAAAPAERRRRARELIECGALVLRVARRDGRVLGACSMYVEVPAGLANEVGCAPASWRWLQAAHAALLTNLEVAPPWRGRGIGRALVSALAVAAAAAGARELAARVTTDAPARGFYSRLGFRRRLGDAAAELWSLPL